MTRTQQTIYLDPETKAKLRLKAYTENISQNKIITEALKTALNSENK